MTKERYIEIRQAVGGALSKETEDKALSLVESGWMTQEEYIDFFLFNTTALMNVLTAGLI